MISTIGTGAPQQANGNGGDGGDDGDHGDHGSNPYLLQVADSSPNAEWVTDCLYILSQGAKKPANALKNPEQLAEYFYDNPNPSSEVPSREYKHPKNEHKWTRKKDIMTFI